jgi:hypothetical protein
MTWLLDLTTDLQPYPIGTHLGTPTESQICVLRAAQSREAGGSWSIQRSIGLDCIEHGWITEDYYLTDLGKRILEQMD